MSIRKATPDIEVLQKQRDQLLAELKRFIEMYVQMGNSGDCGNWDPETEPEVIQARAAIAAAESAL